MVNTINDTVKMYKIYWKTVSQSAYDIITMAFHFCPTPNAHFAYISINSEKKKKNIYIYTYIYIYIYTYIYIYIYTLQRHYNAVGGVQGS